MKIEVFDIKDLKDTDIILVKSERYCPGLIKRMRKIFKQNEILILEKGVNIEIYRQTLDNIK